MELSRGVLAAFLFRGMRSENQAMAPQRSQLRQSVDLILHVCWFGESCSGTVGFKEVPSTC